MANIRDLNQKIASLASMQKVMRAMNMIATVKLRKLFPGMEALDLFSRGVEELRRDLSTTMAGMEHPVMKGHPTPRIAHVILISGDKGLCGSHNNSVQKALELLKTRKDLSRMELELTCLGTKGATYARRKGFKVAHSLEVHEKVCTPEALDDIATHLVRRFLAGEIHEIHLIHNHFLSTIQQVTRTNCLLPLKAPFDEAETETATPVRAVRVRVPASPPETLPEPEEFLTGAAENYLAFTLRTALGHSRLSEQAARMTAMENAGNNSQDLIDRYLVLRNRSRQSTITNELTEIISGKEALKG